MDVASGVVPPLSLSYCWDGSAIAVSVRREQWGRDHAVMTMVGELCAPAVSVVRESVAPLLRTVDDLIVDMSGVSFIDAAGAAMLRALGRSLAGGVGSVGVRNPSPAVCRMLELLGGGGGDIDFVVDVRSA